VRAAAREDRFQIAHATLQIEVEHYHHSAAASRIALKKK
jgi:hypothetical protein